MTHAPMVPLDPMEHDLLRRLAADTRRIDIGSSIGSTFYYPRFTSACRKLRVEHKTEAALVHAAYRAAVLSLPPQPATTVQLAGNQRTVLTLLAEGLEITAIARRTGWDLAYAQRTARALLSRLQARTPWGAVSHAWQLRLLTCPPASARPARSSV